MNERMVAEEGKLESFHLAMRFPERDEQFFYILRNQVIIGVGHLVPGKTHSQTELRVPIHPGDILSVAIGMPWQFEPLSLVTRIKRFFKVQWIRFSIGFSDKDGTHQIMFGAATRR